MGADTQLIHAIYIYYLILYVYTVGKGRKNILIKIKAKTNPQKHSVIITWEEHEGMESE